MFDREKWQEAIQTSYRQFHGWLAQQATNMGLATYGGLTTLTLFPLVEAVSAAAQHGQPLPWQVMMAVGSVTGSVGAGLLTEQIQRWYDRARDGEKVTVDEVLAWLKDNIVTQPELQASLDEILLELEAIQQATAALSEPAQATFLAQLAGDLSELGTLERFQSILVDSGAVAMGDGAICKTGCSQTPLAVCKSSTGRCQLV